MPESFRVKLVNPEQFAIIASAFVGRAGVEQVQDQKALLEKFFKVLNWVQWFAVRPGPADDPGLGDPDREHDPGRCVQPPTRDRHHEAGRRVELLHPAAVPARGRHLRLPRAPRSPPASFVLIKGVLVDQILAPNFPITRFITWGDVWLSAGSGVRHRRGAGRNRQLAGPGQVPSGLISRVPPVTPVSPGTGRSVRSTASSRGPDGPIAAHLPVSTVVDRPEPLLPCVPVPR